jgi:DNA polymerase
LEAEIAVTRPHFIVCLGATAAQALFGADFSVMRRRGQFVPSSFAARAMATVHPSSILRAPDERGRQEQKAAFIRDLAIVAREMKHFASAA